MTDKQHWKPVLPTGREDSISHNFPGYLREAIFPWLQKGVGGERSYFRPDFFIDFQNAIRTDLGFRSESLYNWGDEIAPMLRKLDDETFTNLIDYALSKELQNYSISPIARALNDGGSAWMVVQNNSGYGRLARRIPDGVSEVFVEVLSARDTASKKLQEAWVDAFGVSPRASVAFSNAVVAVETAALSAIPVGSEEATLSSLFSILEAENSKWKLVFRDSDKNPGGRALSTMLRTLWRGHESRHGRPDYQDATLEEARAAVILAATLVYWFTSGVVIEA